MTGLGIGGGEVSALVARACLRSETLVTSYSSSSPVPLHRAVMQLVMQTGKQGGKLGKGALLDVEDWLSLALADRELFAKLTSRGFWLAAVGCTLDGPVSGPKGDVARFSLLSLALKIRREQRAEGAWAKELLCNYRASYSAGGGGVCGDAAAEKKWEDAEERKDA